MKAVTHWLIKIQNPRTKYTLSVFPDGTIYGNERGHKVCVLTDAAIDEIQALVHEDLSIIKNYGYDVQDSTGLIIKFWDNSNKRRELKVKGWRYAEDVMRAIFNESNIDKAFGGRDDLISVLEAFYGGDSNEE